ncbi:MAG: BamA/TamA family outer membrane protein [Deinococcus-Thermus bacterium]|jgi:outer membrane protein insertion porin family|nr:BamA/TamA family outer membrane protein [Deinococcota bacterium]
MFRCRRALRSLPLAVLLIATGWIATAAVAQAPDVRGSLAEVRVEGSDVYADIVRTLVTARPGTPVERIDLEAERNRVYGLGTFATVSVSLVDDPAGPVLLVRVEENPEIGEVVFEGVASLDPGRLRELLAREHLIEAGRVFNTGRADEATRTLAETYRSEGFPFEPAVTLETESAPELADRGERAPLRVRYVVDENARLDRVTFESSAVLSAEELEGAFARVADLDAFRLDVYRAAVRDVADRYAEEGYRQSGVDLDATTLQGGVLDVRFRELTIVSIDTTPLGIDAERLSLEPGDLFDYDALLADVRRLAADVRGDVRLVPFVTQDGGVRVTFELGPPETAGEIDEITFEGNTVLSDERLSELLTLQPGDTFTSTLAEEDFRRIAEAYADAGYAVANRPDYNWLDGTYVQRVTEYRVGAYELTWRSGRPAAEPFVVLRELPPEGSVLSLDALDAGLRALLRQGAVRPVDRRILPSEAGPADEVLVEIVLESAQTGLFQPSAQYSTSDGFSAALSVSERNLWGRAHTIEAEVDARTSDIGFLLGGSVRYAIPWLYVDVLDFRQVPTSASVSAFSTVRTNQPLSDDGATRLPAPGSAGGDANRVPIGEYTQRDTGVSIGAGRALTPDVDLGVRARASLSEITVEPSRGACELDDQGDVTNPNACSFPTDEARAFAPVGGVSGFVGGDLVYDGRDSPDFPRTGIGANLAVGAGFGNDFLQDGERSGYVYVPVEAGVKSYLTLTALTGGAVPDDNHVFAARLNAGHQFGGAYPDAKRFRIGGSIDEATQVRGYRDGDFDLSRSYATASFEYRYDFELSTVATQTLIAVAFADAAWISNVPGYDEYAAPVFAGAGVGLQVNLGFSGVALPALRFDYGFSERNPRGVFAFRIGTVF